MGVFHHNPHHAEAPPPAAHLAFYLASVLACLSALLTALTQRPQPLPLMLACGVFLLGLWRPFGFLPLYHVWSHLLYRLARGLVVMYWCLYILPSGLFSQLRGHDPLQRRFNSTSPTYWQTPQTSNDMRKLD